MDPCQAHRLAIINAEEHLRTVDRGLIRFDRLQAAPTHAQLQRKNDLLRQRAELARARLRDCEKAVPRTV